MKKVMVVDDAHADRINLEKIVAGAGHRVVSAVSGIQALQMARSERPDLIFIDVNLDGMDGFRVTRALQSDFATKGIPLVFVTARGQKADRVWVRILGAQGYLTKPYTDDQIHAQLHASLGSGCEAVHFMRSCMPAWAAVARPRTDATLDAVQLGACAAAPDAEPNPKPAEPQA